MSNPANLGSVLYEAESSWAENVTTFATMRVPILTPVDCSGFQHPKIDSQRTNQYRQGGTLWIPGTMQGSFKTKLYLTGHGSTTSGATTVGLTETLLGLVFGNATASAASGTTLTGGTAAVPLTTASGTFTAGSLCRVGSLGDTRGGGQFYAIATHVTTSLTLIGALKGTPSNGDVLYSAVNIYPSEAPTSVTPTSLRFLLQTSNWRYEAHGCVPTDVALTGFNPGEMPCIEVTWAVSWWQYQNAIAFPNTVATETFTPNPIAGGSLNVQTVGTTTRNDRSQRNFTVAYKLGMALEKGPGGVNQYQDIIGARRLSDDVKVSWTEDAEAAGTNTLDGYWLAANQMYMAWTGSGAAGSAIGAFAPAMNFCDGRPVQKNDQGVNRVSIMAECNTGPTTTSDLTLSAIRFATA